MSTKYPYPTFGISERAVLAILRGEEPPLSLSSLPKDIPIDIISDQNGYVLVRLPSNAVIHGC
jgi:hypothetical protein